MDALNLGFTTIPLEDIGYLAIYLIMVLDGANIPFTPNELFLGFTGYLARTGEVNSVAAYSVGFLGSLTGHLISYALGWKIGQPLVKKYGKYLYISEKRVKKAEKSIKKFGSLAPFIARFIPGLRNVGSLLLGILRFPQGVFVLMTAAGIAIYNALFFLAGYVLAEELSEFKETIFTAVVVIIALGLSFAVISSYRTRKRS